MPDEPWDEYYDRGEERDRLFSGRGRLERDRTRAVLSRHLPPAPAAVLDVGGAAGVHARWLADTGYQLTLLDPSELHVRQARAEAAKGTPFEARLGDARALPEGDGSYDAVLLMGPLYHLVERADRIAALREAYRVAQPGGLVAAAAINRFAPLMDGLFLRMFDQPGFSDVVEHGLVTGQHNPPAGSDWFTLAYLHRPEEPAEELRAAGLGDVDVIAVEGAGHLLPDLDERHTDPAAWQQVLDVAQRLEREPGFLGVTSHFLGVGRTME